ncbi:hypothetical protein BEP19_02690 [Ammoniphilus oxalaticus]|uniref:Uncharacterized protein n=1 Tax=Ammoniphilus oxalaticus TaxID=66863 RepID=A0A419SNL5_9BACL|nr:DUF3908 family protein [Ammoniphilus oxalaticus]RKD25857.1 hypothetical protein BEP19_02690 [Ammoniphilus oxalaticus]
MIFNLDTIYENIHLTDIPKGYERNSIETAINQIKTLGLEEGLLQLYPQGIYTEEMLKLLLFHKNNFTVVSIESKDSRTKLRFETIKYKAIVSIELEMSDRGNKYRQLSLGFGFGNPIKLHSYEDTNMHWSDPFMEKIEHIYRIIRAGIE